MEMSPCRKRVLELSRSLQRVLERIMLLSREATDNIWDSEGILGAGKEDV